MILAMHWGSEAVAFDDSPPHFHIAIEAGRAVRTYRATLL